METRHKGQYKHQADDASANREKRRKENASQRKARRDQLLTSKRMRHGTVEDEEDSITEALIKEVTEKLIKSAGERMACLKLLKKAFAKGTIYTDAFLSVDNAVQCLVGVLSAGSEPELQLQAAWCFTNMAAGTDEQALLAAKEAAPYLITYLSSSNEQLQDQCAWALGNIAGDSPECRDLLQSQGILKPMINLLKSSHPVTVQSAAFALSNLARGKGGHPKDLVDGGAVPYLLKHLPYESKEAEVVAEVAWVLTFLTASHVLEEGVCLELVEKIVPSLVTLSKEEPLKQEAVTPLLRCLGNLCSGPDKYSTHACENTELLDTLAKFLGADQSHHLRKECLWVLSNITATPAITVQVVKKGLVPLIVHLLPDAFDIKKEAAFCMCNLASQGEDFANELLRSDGLKHIIPALKSSDKELLDLALHFVEMMLRITTDGVKVFESCEGLNSMEGLEYHKDEDIRVQAQHILDTYFYHEEEEEEEEEGTKEQEQEKKMEDEEGKVELPKISTEEA